jgi:hypothetical protein
MKKDLFRKGWMTVAVLAFGALVPGVASADASLSCPTQQFSQPFASLGDTNQYSLLPGESAGNFDGTGWQLTGGAKIVTTKLADGTVGQVLDLPNGAAAESPVTCVSSAYPTVRSMIADLSGVQGVDVKMQLNTGTWGAALDMGTEKNPSSGWAASRALQTHTQTITTTTPARFLLTGVTTAKGEYQVYNFYVDPRYIL